MTGPAPTLLEAAAQRLLAGPTHTLELAREVMGLAGNPGLQAKAVFTLLGSDPRFGVDPHGIWTLHVGVEPPGPPLARHRYAVVDVETTGGGWSRGDRITEIAVVHLDNGVVGETFHTLVNPGRPIPPWVQGLTGITDGMVAEAPSFEGIADALAARLRDRVFVAHNVGFDWGFVRSELLEATGDVPELDRLCTVRLGRLLLPRLRSHGLDALTTHYRIEISGRHRALGDALATARLLLRLFAEAEGSGLSDPILLQRAFSPSRGSPSRPARAPEPSR